MCVTDKYKKRVKVVRAIASLDNLENKLNEATDEMMQDRFILTDIKYNSIDIGEGGRKAIEYSAVCIYAHLDVF